MRQKGERWQTATGEEMTVLSQRGEFVRVINPQGKIESLHVSYLRHWLNEKDFPKAEKKPLEMKNR